MEELTADEAEQYDRQIRLWGLDAQKRLRSSTVLVVGLRGLGSEVVKNIVLAGVKGVTILDHVPLSREDVAGRFLMQQEGGNRAEQAVAQLQVLNPNVIVTADSARVGDKRDDFFKRFNVICATCCTTDTLVRLDEICRKNNIKFFCGDVWGYYGYFFTDLNQHEYAMEAVKEKSEDRIEVDTIGRIGRDEMKDIEMTTVKKCTSFCSLRDALSVTWTKKSARYFRRTPPTFFIIQTLQSYRDQFQTNPSPSLTVSQDLLRLKEEVAVKYGVSKDLIPDDFIQKCYSELSPVCAVVGGVLGQEVIKAISAKDIPYSNWFLYDGVRSTGIVETLEPSS